MKLLHFVDSAGSDEHYVPDHAVTLIDMFNNANLKIWFKNSDTNVSDHEVQLGVTAGTADECLLAVADLLTGGGIGSQGVYKFEAGTAFPNARGFNAAANLLSVAYTAGS